MSKEEFTMELINELKAIFGEEYIIISDYVTKNNGVKLLAITIGKQGESIRPNFYVESFYSQFLEGKSIKEISEEIGFIFENTDMMADFDFEKELKEANEKIFFKLINTEANKVLLDNAPHKEWNDLSTVYYIDLSDVGDEDHKTITITNDVMKYLNLSPDELDELAKTNTEEKLSYRIMGISSFICNKIEELGIEYNIESLKEDIFYICTNKNNLFGANTILYKNLLSEFSERMNTETVYLIPSSVHEMLLLPYTDMNTEELNELLNMVNHSEVKDTEILSKNCYIYNRQTDLVSVA